MHLNEGIPTMPVRPRQRPAGPNEERAVLTEVGGDARALVTAHIDPMDMDSVDDALGIVARSPEAIDIHRPTGRAAEEGFTTLWELACLLARSGASSASRHGQSIGRVRVLSLR